MSDASYQSQTNNGLTLDYLQKVLDPGYQAAQGNITDLIEELGRSGELGPTKLLYFQASLTKLTVYIEFMSTFQKSFSEMLKTIIQKMG